MLASKTSVGTNDATGTDIIALVKDANNNLVSGVPVTISATGGNLTGAPFTTDQTGSAKGSLNTSNVLPNGQITLTATAGASTSQPLVIAVTGTALTISGATSATIGSQQTYSLTLVDSTGKPIANQPVSLTTTSGTLSATSVTTDSKGTASFTFTPGTTDAAITATAVNLNAGATQNISVSQNATSITTPTENQILYIGQSYPVTANVSVSGTPQSGASVAFTTTRGTLTASSATSDVSGNATVYIGSNTSGPSLISASANNVTGIRNVTFSALTAQKVIVQATSSVIPTNGSTQIQAQVQDNNGNAVVGATVNFTLQNETSNGNLSATSATTNNQGVATITYTAGGNPDNSFTIQATVPAQQPNQPTAVSGQVALSVAGKSFSVVIGEDNKIVKNDANATYEKTYNVIVTDNTGAPVQGASIQLRALPKAYAKGAWELQTGATTWTQFYKEYPSGTVNRGSQVNGTIYYTGARQVCASEDTNGNGVLDPGEDINGNGTLEPPNIVTFSPANPVTDANGTATFKIIYGQNYGGWVYNSITATAIVSGTEGSNTLSGWLGLASSDLDAGNKSGPAGNPSPFGIYGSCTYPY
ncbi:hypothetical protein A9404_06780 [Halothiobacillus diazotrophicus]|uniref:Big-1 domain-containing protein n=1 Tax=Halothiobacillus diazotrophicus TaxID=1860122 RepID=A0A191ZGZ7_9GAMM|nr:hypothetical protein A9404_06780 [Halothiobacillus diazotrophicus]